MVQLVIFYPFTLNSCSNILHVLSQYVNFSISFLFPLIYSLVSLLNLESAEQHITKDQLKQTEKFYRSDTFYLINSLKPSWIYLAVLFTSLKVKSTIYISLRLASVKFFRLYASSKFIILLLYLLLVSQTTLDIDITAEPLPFRSDLSPKILGYYLKVVSFLLRSAVLFFVYSSLSAVDLCFKMDELIDRCL